MNLQEFLFCNHGSAKLCAEDAKETEFELEVENTKCSIIQLFIWKKLLLLKSY